MKREHNIFKTEHFRSIYFQRDNNPQPASVSLIRFWIIHYKTKSYKKSFQLPLGCSHGSSGFIFPWYSKLNKPKFFLLQVCSWYILVGGFQHMYKRIIKKNIKLFFNVNKDLNKPRHIKSYWMGKFNIEKMPMLPIIPL